MKLNLGLANIPLILGILLLVIAVPVGVSLVQQNQNLQNRAYDTIVAGSVSCTDVLNAKLKYCAVTSLPSELPGVPCTEIDSAITKYCLDTPVPILEPTFTPTPAPITPISVQCLNGQTKCAGRILFACINNVWVYQKTCVKSCINGVCK